MSRGRAGNTRALKHGGEAGVKAIQKGEPLRGPAREAELRVYEELETKGRFSLVKRNAARLQAAADLYWSAISRLMEMIAENEPPPPDVAIVKLDKFVKRYGWLAGASLRAWAQVREEEPEAGHIADYEMILEKERGGD